MRAEVGRLKRRPEFVKVAAARRRWVTPGLVLQARSRDGGGALRVGFTASRKVGGAVARNRARRRLRAAVERVMPERARAGHDFVVIARRATLSRPFDALVGDLEAALRGLGLYRDGEEDAEAGEAPKD